MQGLLFKSLSSPQYYPEVDTLLALADAGIAVTTRSQSLKDTFSFDSDVMMHRIQTNFRVSVRQRINIFTSCCNSDNAC